MKKVKEIIKKLLKNPNPYVTNNNKTAYILLSPWLLGFVLFVLYPIFKIVKMSVNNVKLDIFGWQYEPIGIDNYIRALTNPDFIAAMTAFIVLLLTYIPMIIIVSFILAIQLNKEIKYRVFFRTVFFLPVVLLSNNFINSITEVRPTDAPLLNVESNLIFMMLNDYSAFIGTLLEGIFNNVIIILWFTGVPIILFMNGLQKINRSIFEAAQIDGANSWQILWKISIPSLKSTALVTAIFSIVQLGSFVTNPVFWILDGAIRNTNGGLGIASAYAILYTLVVFMFIGLYVVIFKDEKEDKTYKKKLKEQKKKNKLLESGSGSI